MSDQRRSWEPDPKKLGNWTSMFEPRTGHDTPHPKPAAPEAEFDDAESPHVDPAQYRPWILQRGQTRAGMMLSLDWFDAKSGLWHGQAVAYHSLYAFDTIGDRMVSLDFGERQFIVEGRGLDVLGRHLSTGSILKIVEYASTVWSSRGDGPVVTAIRRITQRDESRNG